MKRRISQHYTVIIARTGKETVTFSVLPVTVWLSVVSLIMVLMLSFLLGWSQGKSSAKKVSLQSPAGRSLEFT